MNENLNLVEILKNCPKGTKLYSTLFGEVEFVEIKEMDVFPIRINSKCGYQRIMADGRFINFCGGECTLFPSKNQRDWSKFNAPWYKNENLVELKESDDESIKTAILNYLKKMWGNSQDDVCGVHVEDAIAWLEKQDEDKKEINNFDVLPGLYKCIHRMFDGTPDGRLLFEIDNVYKCLSKHDRAEFEVSYGHSVYLEDPIVRKYFIPFEGEQIPSPKFKVGDWLYANELNDYANLIKIVKIVDVFGKKRYKISRDYDSDLDLTECDFIEKHYHLWTINDAKDGDVLVHSSFMFDDFIFIYNNTSILQAYCYYSNERNRFIIEDRGHHCPWNMQEVKPATKEQCDLLFQKIKEAGYKWNSEIKTLEKLVEPKFKVGDKIVYILWKNMRTDGSQGIISEITDDKYIFTDGSYIQISNQDSCELVSNRFDPKTLKPFDKVLVRDRDYHYWRCNLFSHIETEHHHFPYTTIGGHFSYCIPYNEETKYLVGTYEDAPKYYRYWEN